MGELTAKPVQAYLSDIAGLAASTRKRKRAAVASSRRGERRAGGVRPDLYPPAAQGRPARPAA
ncbi:hypothetical protein ACIQUM_36920 [Amycolatopsis azurea]|uniref:hypothetical protein n=1 Tax=Amycolatopsis azurea TaxID=36819 RepID=UPI0037F2A246